MGDKSEHEGDFRMRRSHRKSRYGCTKCKYRRIKCDELTPKCSRCKRMNLNCQYPTRQPDALGSENYWLKPIDFLFLRTDPRAERAIDGRQRPDQSSAIPESPSRSRLSAAPFQSLPGFPIQDGGPSLALRLQISQMIAPTDFELLEHYLEHTSRDLTVSDEDQFTLQIGIPHLASQSKPLMKSVLAIAAICKCCDFIEQSSSPYENRMEVRRFLSLANEYHMQSLREIQATLHKPKHYDHILANAAMMGMYGSGSHRARIWLAKTATLSDQPQGDLMPEHSQWIRLFRAVHLAYEGLLNNLQETREVLHPSSDSWTPDDIVLNNDQKQSQYQCMLSTQLERQGSPINHALYPVLAATVGSALNKLRKKARNAETFIETECDKNSETPTDHSNQELGACFEALTIFSNIITEAFPSNDWMPTTPFNDHVAAEALNISMIGQLSGVSPWLWRYTASITSMMPSSLPRRFIMAFIHKVPSQYLTLVEEMIDLIQMDALDIKGLAQSCSTSIVAKPTIAHQLAIEIFGHWLVLVNLLDNVWWIGEIGIWELERIVSLRKNIRWRTCMWNDDEDWWPETMFEISRNFDKYKIRN